MTTRAVVNRKRIHVGVAMKTLSRAPFVGVHLDLDSVFIASIIERGWKRSAFAF